MKIFSTFGRVLAWPCQCVGVIALLAMVLVTMTDVITRFLFSVTGGSFTYTVKGSVELVSYLMLSRWPARSPRIWKNPKSWWMSSRTNSAKRGKRA